MYHEYELELVFLQKTVPHPFGVRKILLTQNAISNENNRNLFSKNQFDIQQRYPANAVNYCITIIWEKIYRFNYNEPF